MVKMVTPMDLALAGMKTWRMQTQSAAVIGLRMAGMAGVWGMPPSEYEVTCIGTEISETSMYSACSTKGRRKPRPP